MRWLSTCQQQPRKESDDKVLTANELDVRGAVDCDTFVAAVTLAMAGRGVVDHATDDQQRQQQQQQTLIISVLSYQIE